MKKLTVVLVLMQAVWLAAPCRAERPDTLDRSEIDDRYKWDLSSIYGDWSEWERELDTVRREIDAFEAFRRAIGKQGD